MRPWRTKCATQIHNHFRLAIETALLIKVTENADGPCNYNCTDCHLVTRYQYDRAGNRTAIIDARGIV